MLPTSLYRSAAVAEFEQRYIKNRFKLSFKYVDYQTIPYLPYSFYICWISRYNKNITFVKCLCINLCLYIQPHSRNCTFCCIGLLACNFQENMLCFHWIYKIQLIMQAVCTKMTTNSFYVVMTPSYSIIGLGRVNILI